MSLKQHLQSFPPYVCRLLSRLTNREIAKRSGLSLRTVIRISHKPNWDSVTIKATDSYMRACGMDFQDLGRHRFRLKRILTSKNGISGLNFFTTKRRLTLQQMGNRAKMMKAIMKAILDE